MVIYNLKKDYLKQEAMGSAHNIYLPPMDWWYNLKDIVAGRAKEWNKLAASNPYYNEVLAIVRNDYWSKIAFYMQKYDIPVQEAERLYGVLIGYRTVTGLQAVAIGPYKCTKNEKAAAKRFLLSVGAIKDKNDVPSPEKVLEVVNQYLPEEKVNAEAPEAPEVPEAPEAEEGEGEEGEEKAGRGASLRDMTLRYRCELLNRFNFFRRRFAKLNPDQVKKSYDQYLNRTLIKIAQAFGVPYFTEKQIAEEHLDPNINAQARALITNLRESLSMNDTNMVVKYIKDDFKDEILPEDVADADEQPAVQEAPATPEAGKKKKVEKERKNQAMKDVYIEGLAEFVDKKQALGQEQNAVFGASNSGFRMKSRGIMKILETCLRFRGAEFNGKNVFDIAMEQAASEAGVSVEAFRQSIDSMQEKTKTDYDGVGLLLAKVGRIREQMIKEGLPQASLMPKVDIKMTPSTFKFPGSYGQLFYSAHKINEGTKNDLNLKINVLSAIVSLQPKNPSGKRVRKQVEPNLEAVAAYLRTQASQHSREHAKGEFDADRVQALIESIRAESGLSKVKGKANRRLSYESLLKEALHQKESIEANEQLKDSGYMTFEETWKWACMEWSSPENTQVDPATRGRLISGIVPFNTTLNVDFKANSEELSKRARKAYMQMRSQGANPRDIKKAIVAELKKYIGETEGSLANAAPTNQPTIEEEAEAGTLETPVDPNVPVEEIDGIDESIEGVQAQKPTTDVDKLMQEEESFEINDMAPTGAQAPAAVTTPPKDYAEIDPVEIEGLSDMAPQSRRVKPKVQPKPEPKPEEEVVSYTLKNLVKIAQDLDQKGKCSAAEEIHKIIRKYIKGN